MNIEKKKTCEIETKLNWTDKEGNSHTFDLEEMQNILNEKMTKGAIVSYVWCVHSKDRYNYEEEEKGFGKQGDLKDEHIHLFLKLKDSRTFEDIGKWFGLGASQIEKCKQQFENACMYAIHANAPDKYQYPVAEAHFAGMDYPAMVEAYKEKFAKDAKKKKSEKRKKEIIDKIDKGIINKINLSQYVSAYEEVIYNNAIKVAFDRKDRDMSLIKDRQMEGIYICGKSGSSKTTLAKLVCEGMGFNFAISGSKRDPVQNYKKEDAYILDDLSPLSFEWKELLKLADNNTVSAVGSRNKDKDFSNCKLLIITHTEEPRTFVDQVPGSRSEEKKQFYRRFKTLYKLVGEDIHVYKYDETEDKYIFVKKEYNQALNYVKYLQAKEKPDTDCTDVNAHINNALKKKNLAFLDLQKQEEEQSENKEPLENSQSGKDIKTLAVDDCIIAYTGSGDNIVYEFNSCVIPSKYCTSEQRKVILKKFDEIRKQKEYEEKKAKEALEQKAKEEEAKKNSLQGNDLIEWLQQGTKELEEENKALVDGFNNNSTSEYFS